MKKFLKKLEGAYMLFLVTLTAVITLLAIYQVLGRYVPVLHLPITWTEEAMRYMYVAIVMLGVGVVSKTESFTTITLFSDMITKRSRLGGNILSIAHALVSAVFFALLLYYGTQLTLQSTRQITATTRLSFAIIYLPLPIGGLMGLIYNVYKLSNFYHQLKGKRETGN